MNFACFLYRGPTHLQTGNGWVGDVKMIFSLFVFKRIFVLKMHVFWKAYPPIYIKGMGGSVK